MILTDISAFHLKGFSLLLMPCYLFASQSHQARPANPRWSDDREEETLVLLPIDFYQRPDDTNLFASQVDGEVRADPTVFGFIVGLHPIKAFPILYCISNGELQGKY